MEDSTLKCSICAKSFSGVVPYSQHMQSAKHLKRQKQVESEVLNTLPTTDDGKLCCSICDMKFSGVIPYTQHINGSIHHKNIRRQKLMNDLYTGHRQNVKPQEVLPQQPAGLVWDTTNIENVSLYGPHPSRDSPLNMHSLCDQLPTTTLGQVPSISVQSYNLWEKVNDSASEMNIQTTQTEGRLKGCGICGIPFFKNSEEHIEHLESNDHFVKKLMSIKSAKSSGSTIGDSSYGSVR